MHEWEYEVERVVLNALATGMRLRCLIACAFGDLGPTIVFGEADPPGNDAANIAGALGFETRSQPSSLAPTLVTLP
jgi:hypothetical protein